MAFDIRFLSRVATVVALGVAAACSSTGSTGGSGQGSGQENTSSGFDNSPGNRANAPGNNSGSGNGASNSGSSSGGNSGSSGSSVGADASVGTVDSGVAGAQPGCNLHTGYADDDLCILPPDPSQGMQLHFGPSNYSDTNEVSKYLIQPGQENVECVYLTTPNTSDIYMGEYHVRMRSGSHHMIVYSTASGTTGQPPVDCENANTGISGYMFGSSTKVTDIPGANWQPAPEFKGYFQKVPKQQLVRFEMHYINAGTTPLLRESWVNIIYAQPSAVKGQLAPMTFIGGLKMNVAPGATQTISVSCNNQGPPGGGAPLIASLRSHYHEHTTDQSVYMVTAGGTKTKVYESFNWEDPGTAAYDSTHSNPQGTASNQEMWATSGDLTYSQGDHLEYECVVHNTTSKALQFGNFVETAEMCNLFGEYIGTQQWVCCDSACSF